MAEDLCKTQCKAVLNQYLYYRIAQSLYWANVRGRTPKGEIYNEMEVEELIFQEKHIASHFFQDRSLETQDVV